MVRWSERRLAEETLLCNRRQIGHSPANVTQPKGQEIPWYTQDQPPDSWSQLWMAVATANIRPKVPTQRETAIRKMHTLQQAWNRRSVWYGAKCYYADRDPLQTKHLGTSLEMVATEAFALVKFLLGLRAPFWMLTVVSKPWKPV